MLDHVTPVPLTPNEEQNIARALSYLAWAKDIVVIDNGSTDGTLDVSQAFPMCENRLKYRANSLEACCVLQTSFLREVPRYGAEVGENR